MNVNTEEARQRVIRAALRRVAADYAEESADAAADSEYADDQLAVAARELAAATDALPAGKQPAGWVA